MIETEQCGQATKNIAIAVGESFADKTKRWRGAMRDSAVGPLLIAKEIVSLADEWEAYRPEVGGMTISQWLVLTFGSGKHLSFFDRRKQAVDRIGIHIAKNMHHAGAVWVAGRMTAENSQRLKDAIVGAWIENGRNPLTMRQVALLLKDHAGGARKNRCAKCAEKDRQIAWLEAKIQGNR